MTAVSIEFQKIKFVGNPTTQFGLIKIIHSEYLISSVYDILKAVKRLVKLPVKHVSTQTTGEPKPTVPFYRVYMNEAQYYTNFTF